MLKETTIFQAHDGHVTQVLFSSDNTALLSAGMDNSVKIWSIVDWELTGVFEGHENSVNAVALNRD